MSDLNQCSFIGRLGADPEIRRAQDGRAIVNLRLAVSETWRDKSSGEKREKTAWVPVVIFSEGLTKVAEQYLRKGSRVFIQGAFSVREWQDKNGEKRFATEIVLQGFNSVLTMLDNPKRGDDGGFDAQPKRQVQNAPASDFDDDMSDAVPF